MRRRTKKRKMESTGIIFKPPKSLSLEGNISENWRKFKQASEIFIKASKNLTAEEEVKVAIFLNLVREEAVELFNTFTLTEQQKKVSKCSVRKEPILQQKSKGRRTI